MSKNLTRKGLALGALVALGSSVIAGAPAQAAQTLTVAPALGTSLVTTAGTKFVVAANVASSVTDTAAATLKFSISNAGKNLSTVAVVAASASAANTAALAGTIVADTTNATIVTAAATGLTVAKTAAVAISTSATATTTADVTAFLDLNANNAIDAGEDTGNTVTIKFIAAADLTAAGTLTAPVVSASAGTLVGKFTTTPVLNGNYATNVALSYTAPATVFASGTALDSSANAQGTDGSWTGTVPTTKIIAGDYTTQIKVGSTLVGTAVKQTVAAVTVATYTNTLTASADAKGVSANVGSIRATAKAATFVSTLKSAATGTPAVAAGIPVVATVRQTAGSATSSVLDSKVVVGTKTLTTLNTDVTIDLVTDANGQVSLPITSTTGTLNDSVSITLSAEGVTATAYVITWVAPTYTVVDSKDDTALATNRAATRGGSVDFDFVVKDQFAQAITGGARLKVAVTGGFTATTYPVLTGGKATVTIKDTQTTTSTADAVAITLQTQDSATSNWSDNAATASYTINISSAALDFDVKVNGGAWTSSTVQGKITGTVTPDEYTASAPTNGVALKNNTWTTSNQVASPSTTVVGQLVTISGKGLLFQVGSKYYTDTVSTFSGTSGDFDVTVFSHTAGDQTVTFATGSVTATAVVTFAAGAPALVSFATPAQAQVGQALDIVLNVTDKWGNAVATPTTGTNAGILSVSSTGTGYFASAAPVANAAGKATVKYIVGTADIGTAYLSATLDLATDVTAAKSIEFGLTDGDVVAGGKRVFVNAEFAKGRTVTVSIDGKRVYSKVQTTDNAVELAFTQKKAGVHTVTVRISGGIVFTEKVTTN